MRHLMHHNCHLTIVAELKFLCVYVLFEYKNPGASGNFARSSMLPSVSGARRLFNKEIITWEAHGSTHWLKSIHICPNIFTLVCDDSVLVSAESSGFGEDSVSAESMIFFTESAPNPKLVLFLRWLLLLWMVRDFLAPSRWHSFQWKKQVEARKCFKSTIS